MAGIIAAITPDRMAIPIQRSVCRVETTNSVKPWSSNAWIKLQAKKIPSPVPSNAPKIEIIEDSINTIFLICFLRVPIALISPISLVLSYTDSESVFVIPKRATKIEIDKNP